MTNTFTIHALLLTFKKSSKYYQADEYESILQVNYSNWSISPFTMSTTIDYPPSFFNSYCPLNVLLTILESN